LKATIENKTTSVTTHLQKLTTENIVFIVLALVYSNCHIMQFLHHMFNVSALLLDDTLKPATSLPNFRTTLYSNQGRSQEVDLGVING